MVLTGVSRNARRVDKMETSIIDAFIQYGALGLVCIVAIVDISYLQRRIFLVVDNNTKALAELKATIERFLMSRGGE